MMKITELYIYPIKSLGPLAVPRTRLRREGAEYDRRFMLLEVQPDGNHRPIQIARSPACALFRQQIDGSDVVVTYHVPSRPLVTPEPPEQRTALRVPLSPELEGRHVIDVSVAGSRTTAYRMGDPYDTWFTACFGYDVMLVYIGDQNRAVLAHRPSESPLWRQPRQQQQAGWLDGISSYLPGVGVGLGAKEDGAEQLTFNDVAPFLVVSKASLRDVSRRLPEGETMDLRRFRPNIVVDGDPQAPDQQDLKAWTEDYWAELGVTTRRTGAEHRLALTANCGRCGSINVDYDTGRLCEGEAGIVFKKLMADRRVDQGNKYSPVFGRYAFLAPGEAREDDGGIEIAVGDDVQVTKVLDSRDTWAWPAP